MYKNILVPVALDHGRDVGEAVKVAECLADKGAKITALHVMDEIPTYVEQYIPKDQFETNRNEVTARLKAEFSGNPDVDVVVVSGGPGYMIVDYAKSHEADCIVVASHRPGLQDYFLGSTAARVVRHAPCAVHVSR